MYTVPSNPYGPLIQNSGSWFYDDEHFPAGLTQGKQITDAIMESEVSYLQQNGFIPNFTDDTIVVMFLPPGFGVPHPFDAAHGAFLGYESSATLFAWFGYPSTTVPGLPDGGGLVTEGPPWTFGSGLSHEIMEATTDPWGAPPFSDPAYEQDNSGGCEIADICEYNNGDTYYVQTQSINNNPGTSQSSVQQFMSNEALSCVYARSSESFLFGYDPNGHLWAEEVTAKTSGSGPSYSGWVEPAGGAPSGAAFTFSPAAASWGPDEMDVFNVETDDKTVEWLHTENVLEGWSPYYWNPVGALPNYNDSQFGTTVAFAPDAASYGAGNVQVWLVATWLNKITHLRQYDILWNGTDWGGPWYGWQYVAPYPGHHPILEGNRGLCRREQRARRTAD